MSLKPGMGILPRVNLLVGLAAVVGAAVAGYVVHSILESETQRELLAEAGMLPDSAVAMRTYTSDEIEPLLADRLQKEFLPQSVPFYAATQNFLKLHEKFPRYSYKEATLNPTSPTPMGPNRAVARAPSLADLRLILADELATESERREFLAQFSN